MNELTGMETLTAGQQADSMKQEIATLKAIVKNLTQKLENAENQISSLRLVTEPLKTGDDVQRPVHDVQRPGGDVPRFGGDVPKFGGDVTSSGGDVSSSGDDVPGSGHDVPGSGHDVPDPDRDGSGPVHDGPDPGRDAPMLKLDMDPVSRDKLTPAISLQDPESAGLKPVMSPGALSGAETQKNVEISKIDSLSNLNTLFSYPKTYARDKKGIVETLRKVDETKTREITEIINSLYAVTLGSYETREQINKALDAMSSYLTNNGESSGEDLKKRITEEIVFLKIKLEIFRKLKRLDLMKSQSDRLTREVIYLVEESAPDIKMLMSKFKVPNITIYRDVSVFRKIGWVKTTGRGPTARYVLTDEPRNFISQLIGKYNQ